MIHNGRFSLPAGTLHDQRAVQRSRARSPAAAVAADRPQRSAAADVDDAAAAGPAVQAPLWLPVDASFVGLRGPVELERAVASITITPVAVVDAGARPLVPVVLAAADYPAATLFFHDEQLYPEPNGFWTHRRARVARHRRRPARTDGAGGVAHASGRDARTPSPSARSAGRAASTLVPGQAVEVELPIIRQRRGAADDRRRLGVFSEGRRSAIRPTAASSASGSKSTAAERRTNTMTTLADLRREYASRALTEDAARCRSDPAVHRVVRGSADSRNCSTSTR